MIDRDTNRLVRRIRRFSIDRPGTVLTFEARLARENGWTVEYAQRVVEEYKRFMVLAATADHVVTPSEDVDHAWHLHLTYTHSYWEDLCGECLGMPIHHQPTEGGSSEQAKYNDLYERTLATYASTFGFEPPRDIWPAADVRFGDDLVQRWVKTRQNWVIPRPRFLNGLGRKAGWVAPALVPAAAGSAWSPLDLAGPEFLALYAALYLVSTLVALFVRSSMRAPAKGGSNHELERCELAILNQDGGLAATAALTRLLLSKTVVPNGETLVAKGPLSPDASPVEHGIVDAVSEKGDRGLSFQSTMSAGRAAAARMTADLRSRGFLETASSYRAASRAALLSMSPVALIGIAKLVVGIQRNRPVGFLTLFLILVGFTMYALAKTPRLTATGARALERERRRHDRLKSKTLTKRSDIDEAAIAVALFGPTMLSSSFFGLPEALQHDRASSSAGWWSSGCGAGGSGCGGGGCGGCGGCGG